MTRLAHKLSYRELDGKAPGSQVRDTAIMDAGLGPAPLQDYGRTNVIPFRKRTVDLEKERTPEARKKYEESLRFDRVTSDTYKPKKRRGKPYNPAKDGPNARRDNVVVFNAELGNRVVEDPYRPGFKIIVTTATRHDLLGRELEHGRIKQHQFEAGRQIEQLFEVAERGELHAMDFTKEPVDGRGHGGDGFRDWHRDCGKKIKKIKDDVLDADSYALMVWTLAYGQPIYKAADHIGVSHKKLAAQFRDTLSRLAEHFKLSGAAPGRKAANDKYRDLWKLKQAA